ncbi:hypothetical protein DID76_02050 [Candidatus Marinamargulisbacteria bacterium SCGC AG-414-C22]|nr:hypothetical protein DID76_02050 [Candidatus Marinamargulisbacteria bacterium SCGC AG-414-C22]
MDTETKSYLYIGKIFSYIYGIFGAIYSVAIILFLFQNLLPVWSIKFFNQAGDNLVLLNLLFWASIVINIALLGIVIAFQSITRNKNIGAVTWVTIISIIGIGSSLYQNAIVIRNLSPLVNAFNFFNQELQVAVSMIKTFEGDMMLLYSISIGLWFLMVSFLAKDSQFIPKRLIILGYIMGAVNIMNAVSVVFVLSDLYLFSWIASALIMPIWGISEGSFLGKSLKGNK